MGGEMEYNFQTQVIDREGRIVEESKLRRGVMSSDSMSYALDDLEAMEKRHHNLKVQLCIWSVKQTP